MPRYIHSFHERIGMTNKLVLVRAKHLTTIAWARNWARAAHAHYPTLPYPTLPYPTFPTHSITQPLHTASSFPSAMLFLELPRLCS